MLDVVTDSNGSRAEKDPAISGTEQKPFRSIERLRHAESSERQARVGSRVIDSAVRDYSIKLYLDEIGKHELLTKQDEYELWAQMRNGDSARELLESEDHSLTEQDIEHLRNAVRTGEEAKERFITANLRLVVTFAKTQVRDSSSRQLLDIIQDGNLGLMRAVEKFDASLGYKFSTYANHWIRQAITRNGIDYERDIRLPPGVYEEHKQISQFTARYVDANLGKLPTVEEIVEATGIKKRKIIDLLNLSNVDSLDAPIGSEDGFTVGDTVPDSRISVERVIELGAEEDMIEQILSHVDSKSAYILRMRYFVSDSERKTLEELGQEFELTRERIRQLEKKALAIIKAKIASGKIDLDR